MARYKPIDTQPKFLPINLAAQLLPGTFEHAVHHQRCCCGWCCSRTPAAS